MLIFGECMFLLFFLLVTGAPSLSISGLQKSSINFPALCWEFVHWGGVLNTSVEVQHLVHNRCCCDNPRTCNATQSPAKVEEIKSASYPIPKLIASRFYVGGGKCSKRIWINPYVAGLFPQFSSPTRVSLANPGSLGVFSHSCSGPFGGFLG